MIEHEEDLIQSSTYNNMCCLGNPHIDRFYWFCVSKDDGSSIGNTARS